MDDCKNVAKVQCVKIKHPVCKFIPFVLLILGSLVLLVNGFIFAPL